MPIENYDKVKSIFIANATQEQIIKIAKEHTGDKQIDFNLIN
jgi:hypothetical protein